MPITIRVESQSITVGAPVPVGTGEANDAANVGGGAEIFRNKIAATLNLRTLIGSSGVVVSEVGDTIDISGPTPLGDVVGPSGSTANAPAVYADGTGKVLKDPDAALDLAGQSITNVGLVDGRDVSADGTTLDAHVANTANPHATTAGQVGADPAGSAAAAVAAHEVAGDPHPQYTTTVEAGAAAPVQSVNTQTGAVVLGAGDVGADPAGTAAAAVVAHEGAPDPHPQYTDAAEAAAAAPVQSVNTQVGAVVLGAVDVGADPTGTAATAVSNHETAYQHANIPTGTQKAALDAAAAPSGANPVATIADLPVASTGDVVGPSGAVADNIALFDGTTGKLIKDGGQKLSDFVDISDLSTHVGDTGNPHSVTATQAGAIPATEKGSPGGVATLDGTTKLTLSELPDEAISQTYVVPDQASRLALPANIGDVAVQTDIGASFKLRVTPPSALGSWEELVAIGQGVQSVNGDSGPAISLDTDDIPEASNLYYTESRVSSNTDVAANTAHRNQTTGNPHQIAVGDLIAGNLADLNSKVTDATLDDSGDSRPPAGAASGQLGGSYPGPDVRGLRETGGPTNLTIGSVGEGQALVRSGVNLVGQDVLTGDRIVQITTNDTNPAALDSKISAGIALDKTILNPGGNEILEIDVSLGTGADDAAAGDDGRFPTTNEKQALLGTDGSPSTLNRYVTNSDPRNTDARTPTGSAGGGLNGIYPNPGVNGMTGGSLTDDTAHGNRGGGVLHPLAVAGGANGFLSGADKTKLDNLNPDVGDAFVASATGDTTTSSTTDVTMAGLTITPGAGNYIAFFRSSTFISGNNDATFSIYANGSQLAYSEAEVDKQTYRISVCSHALVTGLGDGQAIDVRWRVTGGSVTASSRSLILLRVN